jgi:hypothetical protein
LLATCLLKRLTAGLGAQARAVAVVQPALEGYATLTRQRGRVTCRRLVLTHLGQDMLSRRAEVQDGIADDGLEIVF